MEPLLSSQTQPGHKIEQGAPYFSCHTLPWGRSSTGAQASMAPRDPSMHHPSCMLVRETFSWYNCSLPWRHYVHSGSATCTAPVTAYTHLQPLVGADSKHARPLTLPQRNSTAPFFSCCKTSVVLAAAWPSLIHSFAAHFKASSPTAAGCRSHYAHFRMQTRLKFLR